MKGVREREKGRERNERRKGEGERRENILKQNSQERRAWGRLRLGRNQS